MSWIIVWTDPILEIILIHFTHLTSSLLVICVFLFFSFLDVIEAIAKYAFETSPYPIVLR